MFQSKDGTIWVGTRITSYNVCYTKLLRSLFGQTLAKQVAQILAISSPTILEVGAGSGRLAADLLLALEGQGKLVITSYSIHYTKLYDYTSQGHFRAVECDITFIDVAINVITSYSIHYTKLYDACRNRR